MNDLISSTNPLILNLISGGLAVLFIFIGVKLVNRFLISMISNNVTRYTARKFLNVIAYLISGLVLMVIFNYKLSNLTLALGVAGAGIAFALQEVIVSVAGFLAVLSGNFYKVGDRVQLGGIKGDVIDIGVLRTTIMEIGDWVKGDLYNGKMVRVANSFVFKEPVSNYSGDFPFLWDEITIPLRHGSEDKVARELFLNIMQGELGEFTKNCAASWQKLTREMYVENARIEPMVSMVFDENWITYTLRYVVDIKKRRITKDLLFQKIKDGVDQSGGKLQIATAAMEVTTITG